MNKQINSVRDNLKMIIGVIPRWTAYDSARRDKFRVNMDFKKKKAARAKRKKANRHRKR